MQGRYSKLQRIRTASRLGPLVILMMGLHPIAHADRTVRIYDTGWKFSNTDQPEASQPDYPDHGWRILSVPHDWAFEADYAPDAAQTDRGGYKPGGVGWYRNTFECPESWLKKRVRIEFDAVYMNSEVWINGVHLGKRPYGYISFGYELSAHLQPGLNTVAVRVDNQREPSARWYHGCGIYGHVRLVITDPVHIVPDGVFVTTPQVEADRAEVQVDVECANTTPLPVHAVLETVLIDPGGTKVGAETRPVVLPPQSERTTTISLNIPKPRLWEPSSPHLYEAVSRVLMDHAVADEVRTRFGIRTLAWKKDTGFWLNGRNVKLRGVCEHLEGGPVGAAYPDALVRWKIQLLKEMGCNAIRVAHNPQVPAFYDLCDEMGMLVMDEIFDGWKRKATEDYGKQAFGAWWERDLRAWLRRDRNHPSIIIWSLGNETGGEIAPELVRICHELDPTRLTTSGHSGSAAMDVYGVNGSSEKMGFFEHPPEKPFVSTEAPHTWQVRDFYRTRTWFRDGYPNKRQQPFPCPDLTEVEIFTYDWAAPESRTNRKQVFNSSYDNAMVRITARKNWELMRDLPWYGGHFRWTGFDYLGEAGYVHGGWPFRAFMGGALDLAGFKKDLFYFYQSQWTSDPMAHILPHWTHPRMKVGTLIPVWVYSNCDEVELFLNDKSLGKDRPGTRWDEMQCAWMVPWTEGKLEAVGYREGREVVRSTRVTAGAPARLKLHVEGTACPIITVIQTDQNGVRYPYAQNRIHYHLDGPARILSLESGNPVNTENNAGNTSRPTFFGKGRAFLQTTGATGAIRLMVGAICGDLQLMTSDRVHVVVDWLNLRGDSAPGPEPRILYSIDGSDPSRPYVESIVIKPNTTVKVDVYLGKQRIFQMEERFGPDEGLYWGDATASEAVVAKGGDQAEDTVFQGAKVLRTGKNFHGKGYLDFGHNQGAFVEWYQENDGGPGTYELHIRYSGKPTGRPGRALKLTVNGKSQALFLPSTGGYGTDWKILKVDIPLQSGANTIRLTTTEKGGMNIDEMSVR